MTPRHRRSCLLALLALLVLAPAAARAQMPYYDGAWGSYGTGDGQFRGPQGVAVDAAGNVYVTDAGNSRVEVFDWAGNYLRQWGALGGSPGQMSYPTDIGVDPSGNVFVYDSGNTRIEKFTGTAGFVRYWAVCGAVAVDPSGFVYSAGASVGGDCVGVLTKYSGDGAQVFRYPMSTGWNGFAVDAAGSIYATAAGTSQVLKYSSAGQLVRSWGSGGYGHSGRVWTPMGIAVDGYGRIYVTDTANHAVYIFDNDGNYLQSWGVQGSGVGQFKNPSGIAVAPDGLFYVADAGNNRVQVYAHLPVPAARATWGQLKAGYR